MDTYLIWFFLNTIVVFVIFFSFNYRTMIEAHDFTLPADPGLKDQFFLLIKILLVTFYITVTSLIASLVIMWFSILIVGIIFIFVTMIMSVILFFAWLFISIYSRITSSV